MDPQQEAQQKVRLALGSLTVDNILLSARVQELEARIAALTAELIEARSSKAPSSPPA